MLSYVNVTIFYYFKRYVKLLYVFIVKDDKGNLPKLDAKIYYRLVTKRIFVCLESFLQ